MMRLHGWEDYNYEAHYQSILRCIGGLGAPQQLLADIISGENSFSTRVGDE